MYINAIANVVFLFVSHGIDLICVDEVAAEISSELSNICRYIGTEYSAAGSQSTPRLTKK